jgi:signal peptidase I
VATAPETKIVRPSPKGPKGPPPQQSHLAREIIETILLTALVYFVVRSTIQFTPINGPSMQPGLHTGESVIVNQLAYVFGGPQRGDVIVFHPPSSPKEQYIKRVIAIPGDSITITDSAVIVDDVQLDEPYINREGGAENSDVLPTIKLHPGEYFVMGDNRGDSIDSRIFGSVPRQNIIGQAEFVIWPFDSVHWIGTYHNTFATVKP